MKLSIKKLSVLLCALTITVFAAQLFLNRSINLPRADSASCEVYKSFYQQEADKKQLFFRSYSRPYISRHTKEGLMPFERDTGRFKLIKLSEDSKPFKKPIKEEFIKDVSGFLKPLLSDKSILIKHCFNEETLQPRFYDGQFKWLLAREELFNLLRQKDNFYPAITSLSPVGFSKDGRHALLYVNYYCEGLCGGKAFYLFERQNGSWKMIGNNQFSAS